ncbi:MAG: glycosyltransferase 87 family protein [Ktedonobacterales bacterium]
MGWPSTRPPYEGSLSWTFTSKIPLLRVGALLGLGIAALPLYWLVLRRAPTISAMPFGYFWPELGLTVIAVLAAWLVLTTTSASTRRARALELAVILALGGTFRLLAFPSLPTLSHDAYRYVWDAHLVAHGVSPYVHPVNDPSIASLRDTAIWPRVNWRDAVTIYPPGAQLLFLAVHAVAPLNIWAMKAAIELCDVLAGVVTLLLLRQRSMDLRRVILYWWSPIPVVEFAANAHIDAAAVLWVLLALLLVGSASRPARLGAGLFLGLAALTKLYPLIFALALVRRRDWSFVLGLAATCTLAYLPFVRLGLGGGGFLGTYLSQRFVDQGLLFRVLGNAIPGSTELAAFIGLAAVLLCGIIARLRWQGILSVEASLLALTAVWIVLSPHLFPWYVAGVLPILALLPKARWLPLPLPLPALALWLFVLLMPFTYVVFASNQAPEIFQLFFVVPLVVAAVPLALAVRRRFSGWPAPVPVD